MDRDPPLQPVPADLRRAGCDVHGSNQRQRHHAAAASSDRQVADLLDVVAIPRGEPHDDLGNRIVVAEDDAGGATADALDDVEYVGGVDAVAGGGAAVDLDRHCRHAGLGLGLDVGSAFDAADDTADLLRLRRKRFQVVAVEADRDVAARPLQQVLHPHLDRLREGEGDARYVGIEPLFESGYEPVLCSGCLPRRGIRQRDEAVGRFDTHWISRDLSASGQGDHVGNLREALQRFLDLVDLAQRSREVDARQLLRGHNDRALGKLWQKLAAELRCQHATACEKGDADEHSQTRMA